MSTRRPSLFIGSSTEGLGIAKAIQINLDHACEPVIWCQGVFGLSEGPLETLVRKLHQFDFAILVLTPDDLIYSRRKKRPSPRDNVLFELGLFIGGIGRERTFIVYDRMANLKLPTDLAGVTLATYQTHATGNLQAALGPPCTQIELAIQQLEFRSRDSTSEEKVQQILDTTDTGKQTLGKRGDSATTSAFSRIIERAGAARDGFLCIAGIANKELFGPIDAQRTLWPAVQGILQLHENESRLHQVRVMFLDPDSQSAHAREVFETKPVRRVPVNTRQLIRSTLGQARICRNQNPNLHIRLASDVPCFLFFNQEEMLYHPYLNSAVGRDTEVTLAARGSEMYDYGVRHFESYWQGRWILFDLGNVLVNFDHAQVSSKLWEYLSKSEPLPTPVPTREEIHSFFFAPGDNEPSRNQQMEFGRHDMEWLRWEFCDHFHCSIDLRTFQDIWNAIFGRRSSEAIACIDKLQGMGIMVGICSNTNLSHWEWICGQHPDLTGAVNKWFLSYEVHARKPDFAFFEGICERTQVPACNHLLIDDLPENVLGARAAGMQGEVFTSFQQVLELVQRRFWNSCYMMDAIGTSQKTQVPPAS